MKSRLIGLFICLMIFVTLYGQQQQRVITAKYINEEITIDGVLDEAVWQMADKGGDFWQFFPTDTAISINPTEFSILYDDQNLYIGIRAGAKSDNYVRSSGAISEVTEAITLLLCLSFKDGTTAFFSV